MIKIMVTGIGGPAVASCITPLEKWYTVIRRWYVRGFRFQVVKVHMIHPASHPSFLEKLYTLAIEESIQLLIPTVSEELPILTSEWKKWSDIPLVIGQRKQFPMQMINFWHINGFRAMEYAFPSTYCLHRSLRLRIYRLVWDGHAWVSRE